MVQRHTCDLKAVSLSPGRSGRGIFCELTFFADSYLASIAPCVTAVAQKDPCHSAKKKQIAIYT